jgi:NADH:ubiquinone oxidoreductase subunit E
LKVFTGWVLNVPRPVFSAGFYPVRSCGMIAGKDTVQSNREDEMGKIVVEVCAGTHCTMMGSMNIMDAISSLEDIRQGMENACEIEVRAVPCMNLCRQDIRGPIVKVDGLLIEQAESESVMAAVMDLCTSRQTRENCR